MKIQQHDGVVVDAAVTAAGLRRSSARGRGVAGEREAPRHKDAAAPPSPLYIGPLGGCAGPRRWDLLGGGGGDQGVECPPRQVEASPPLGFPTLGAEGGPGGAHQPTRGWFPSPLQPMGPSGMGGPTRWTPGTHPVVPVQYR